MYICQPSTVRCILIVLQVDTKNILFICGGAFSDLGKIISERHHRCPFGFGTPKCRELQDYASTNALEESSLLEVVSIVASFATAYCLFIPE